MLSQDELQKLRDVRIQMILGVPDNGRMHMIKCVFHDDRTPSLAINPNNSFHCFGCGVHGNGAIDLCQKLGYGFMESLEELLKYI